MMPSAATTTTATPPPEEPFFSIRIDDSTVDVHEEVMRFEEQNQLEERTCEFVRTTQGDHIVCFVKFGADESLMHRFIGFLKKEKGDKLPIRTLKTEHELNLQLPGNLYIRGLLPATRTEDLYGIFSQYGDILSCKIIYDDFGFSKGYGFINYANRAQADAAIENLNGCSIDGNMLFINHHVSKKDRLKEFEIRKQNYSNLYVKNVPPHISDADFQQLFEKYGKIESVFLPRSGQDNKGYGFVNFKYHDDAVKAEHAMNEYEAQPGYKFQISRAERKKDRFQIQKLNSHYDPNYLTGVIAATLPGAVPRTPPTSVISPTSPFYSIPSPPSSFSPPADMVEFSPETALTEEEGEEKPFVPPFVVAPDANLISTATGLPIAGPEYQDSNLYITHLPLEFRDEDLHKLFSRFGPIVSAKVITYQRNKHSGLMDQRIGSRDAKGKDPESLVGMSKGFGFVCYAKPLCASQALVAMNGYKLDGSHILNVSFAQRKENKVEKGRLHHYNQNNLGSFYRYLNFSANKAEDAEEEVESIVSEGSPQLPQGFVPYPPYVFYPYVPPYEGGDRPESVGRPGPGSQPNPVVAADAAAKNKLTD